MPCAPHLFTPLDLPNGARLRNRIVKSAMSDALGDGRGDPTAAQARLYRVWAEGGVAVSIIGEVQGDARFPEAPGNLVLGEHSDTGAFAALSAAGHMGGTQLWFQLGHAGALTPPRIGTPKGPSALDLPGLRAEALTLPEIRALPAHFAATARHAERLGASGVQIHAAHGFLLSQFLSPLFNRRGDSHGGGIANRMRLLLDIVEAVRAAIRPATALSVKLNASDQLDGGLAPEDALEVVAALDRTGVDLIDISGGTYFPGAKAASDRPASGPYFLEFAAAARQRTRLPLMATGGFRRRQDAEAALRDGTLDAIGLARALVLDPALPSRWRVGGADPDWPRFATSPPGGVTAWFTQRMATLAANGHAGPPITPEDALRLQHERGAALSRIWRARFGAGGNTGQGGAANGASTT